MDDILKGNKIARAQVIKTIDPPRGKTNTVVSDRV